MKLLKSGLVLAVSLLCVSLAQAAITSFVKKEVNKSGKTEYTYKYTCSGGAQGLITFSANADDSARKMADVKAKTACEE